jgi:hypothetical protein
MKQFPHVLAARSKRPWGQHEVAEYSIYRLQGGGTGEARKDSCLLCMMPG